jgi:FkbM family methyltransferase
MNKLSSIFSKKNNKSSLNRNESGKTSYSQTGEDLIMNFIFEQLHISKPNYLDIGAHHPLYLSNTYFFYQRGCRGVNVEPDPYLIKEFKAIRKEDINLNVGGGINNDEEKAQFYVMTTRTLNTFSQEEALKIESYGSNKIEEIIQVPLIKVNSLIENNFSNKPNFISIDVEGLDFEILKSFDFEKYSPEVFCI